MKRILSALLVLTICVSQLSVVSVASYDDTDCLSVDKFTGKLVELINGNDDLVEFSGSADLHYSGVDGYEADVEENDLENLRLVVKSEEKLPELDSVGYIYGYNDLHILQFDNSESFEKAKEYYASLSCVEYVEEDSVFSEAVVDEGVVVESAVEYPTSVQSNLFGYSSAKEASGTNLVDIAVIDSGVQHDHDFLTGRVVDTGFNSISDNGTAYDDRGHGTHVAGIIVANTNSNVTVYAYKVLNSAGTGTATQIALGIDAAVEDGVDIINLSVQMKGISQTIYDAVLRAHNSGITVIVSAGNAGVDLAETPYSPGSFTEAISVMSCSNARQISSFSNYGTPCDFAAPGENVLSTYINNTYKVLSGTSMAAPFICAAASYLLADDSSLTPDEVYTALSAQTEWCLGSPAGKCVYPAAQTDISQTTSVPVFSLDSCTFVGSFSVSISCNDENADIFYSIDNEEILREYTEPFEINNTTKITAFSLLNGKNVSESVTVVYTLLDSDISDFIVDESGCLVGYNGNDTVVTVPEYINSQAITSVSADAFSHNTSITEIIFGKPLLDVFRGAFIGCDALTSIVAPALKNVGANAFANCLRLSKVEAPMVVSVGDEAFKNCSALTKFTSIYTEEIGDYAFYGCSSLQTISLNYLASVGIYAFTNCSSLLTFNANTLSEIDESVLAGCDSLGIISLSAIKELPVSSENGRLFGGLPALNSFSGNNITFVPSYAFCDFEKLENISMCAVTSIGDYSFSNTSLLSCEFNMVTQVGDYSFENSRVKNVVFSELTSLNEGVFSGCQLLETVSLQKITQVPDNAFYNCISLTTAVLPSCSIFGAQSFMNCSSLTTLNISSKTTIGDRAFYGCSSFLPENLLNPVSIGSEAFYGTITFTKERFEPNTLKYVSENAFSNVDIDILILGNVIELHDVTDDGIVLVGSKVTSCSLPSDKGSTIYSPKGTLVSQYCIENGLNYIEYNAQTAILENPAPFLNAENRWVYFNVLGFNLKGRWYWCNDNSDETSLYCEGAFTESYSDSDGYYRYYPSTSMKYQYFYCVVTSNETDGHQLKFRSSFVHNSYMLFDVTGKTTYKKSIYNYTLGKTENYIFSEERSFAAVMDSLVVRGGTSEILPTVSDNGSELYGTGSVINLYDSFGDFYNSYYIVIYGDVNGDGNIDVLDCAKMGLVINELGTIDDLRFSYASDVNGDRLVDIFDYQSIVNMTVM